MAHLVCGASAPIPVLHENLASLGNRTIVPFTILFGAIFGLIALTLIESMRWLERVVAAFGFVSVLAAAANTPIAAAVMGMELLPHDLGVYAALCAGTAYLLVGHRSVYASQKLGLSKSGGLDVPVDVPIGQVSPAEMRIRKGSLTEALLDGLRQGGKKLRKP